MFGHIVLICVLGVSLTVDAQLTLSECSGVSIINGAGYLAHNTRCDRYIQCDFKESGMVNVYDRPCPCGLFWNQDVMTCVSATQSSCAQDPCSVGNVNSWAYMNNCSAYWTCNAGKTDGTSCCPDGQAYNPTHATDANAAACIANSACTGYCPCDDRPTDSYPCAFTVNTADPNSYIDTVTGEVMPCAPGTTYNTSTCGCTTFIQIVRQACPIDFQMSCASYPIMDIANRGWILNERVAVDPGNNACQFDGVSSRLMLLRYANMDWRYKFTIEIEFERTGGTSFPQMLLYNTECTDESPSIIMQLSTTNQIEASIRTVDGTLTLTESYASNTRVKAFLWYDGENVRFRVINGNSPPADQSQAVTRKIERVHCAMQVGWGPPDLYFQGNIYGINAYVYCVPKDYNPS